MPVFNSTATNPAKKPVIYDNITIDISDVDISSADIPGWQVINQEGITVALDVTISRELEEEGLSREFVNRIQNIRKERGFKVTDKILIIVEKNQHINNVIQNNLSYICSETLAESLELADSVEGNVSIDLVGDISVNVQIKKK